ncbi:MAG: putative quinol monooxygenase [Actinomycetota bacterium]
MAKISLLAKLTAADGKVDELNAALATLASAGDEESGLEIYSFHRSNDDENVIYAFELYTDQAALDVHGKGETMRAAMGAMGSLLAARPEVTLMSPVAAKGMDI